MNNAINNSIIYPNVSLGHGTTVDAYCIVGQPYQGATMGKNETTIGRDSVIRSHTVIYAGVQIGDRIQTGHHTLIRNGTTIGNDCSVDSGSTVEFAVQIGNGVRLHSNVFVPEYSILEDGCWIGPNVDLTNAKYPRSSRAKEEIQGVHIEQGAKIGANATILAGVRIGRDALIGAGAVVTHDVPAGAVMVGNPAKQINQIENLPY
jgi:acetyltransferase-like isoleucine patch superfamily enzyme